MAADTARFRLRSATAADHERVDGLLSGADLGQPERYGRFLSAQAAAHIPVENALTIGGAESLLPDWPRRLRAPLLIADLRELGLPVPPGGAVPALHHPAAMLGAIYVLEGSRLGGRILRRRVPAPLPTGFLGSDDPAAWRDLVGLLDERLQEDKDLSLAITAAIAVFAVFEHTAARFLTDVG